VLAAAGPVHALVAGLTGFDASQAPVMAAMAASVLGMSPKAVLAMNDIELTCHAAGDAYVVYAGTGSIAAFIDATGTLQRAGGRGAIIDDAGSGHWLARQALCRVWRAEDDAPGTWQHSPLAQRLFARIGSPDWAQTRAWVYGASRGEMGTLALAVAEAADQDPLALALLHQAGAEIARLGLALIHRHGPRPLVMAGRVFALHPAVQAGLRMALPPGTDLRTLAQPAHLAAAQMAARAMARAA
jgi:N-acetylglucosamine kinase-like BadF-type ATPase